MPSNDYFAASYPEPWQVLGVSLKPFSLGHYFKLKRLGCAFVSDGEEFASLKDLLLGVLVCSMTSDPDPEQDPFWKWLNSERKSWRLRLRNLFTKKPMTQAEYEVFRWGRKVGAFDFKGKVELFASYIKEHSDPPGFWPDPNAGSGGTTTGAHWSHGILHALTSRCGYSLKEAYNLSLRKAFADVSRESELQGGGRMMTPEEIAFSEAAG